MPKLAVYKFLTFFIYSSDLLNEPHHVHIVKDKGRRNHSAKVWLKDFEVVRNGTLTKTELKIAIRVLKKNRTKLLESILLIENGSKVKTIKF